MHWSLTLVTGPVAEPISSTAAKVWLRLSHTVEDALIDDLIQMVREQVEEHGIAVMTQTWDLRLDRFPSVIRIPMTPVQEVSSISYIDTNGDSVDDDWLGVTAVRHPGALAFRSQNLNALSCWTKRTWTDSAPWSGW